MDLQHLKFFFKKIELVLGRNGRNFLFMIRQKWSPFVFEAINFWSYANTDHTPFDSHLAAVGMNFTMIIKNDANSLKTTFYLKEMTAFVIQTTLSSDQVIHGNDNKSSRRVINRLKFEHRKPLNIYCMHA